MPENRNSLRARVKAFREWRAQAQNEWRKILIEWSVFGGIMLALTFMDLSAWPLSLLFVMIYIGISGGDLLTQQRLRRPVNSDDAKND